MSPVDPMIHQCHNGAVDCRLCMFRTSCHYDDVHKSPLIPMI